MQKKNDVQKLKLPQKLVLHEYENIDFIQWMTELVSFFHIQNIVTISLTIWNYFYMHYCTNVKGKIKKLLDKNISEYLHQWILELYISLSRLQNAQKKKKSINLTILKWELLFN